MSTEYLNYLLTGKFGIAPSAGTPFFLIDQQTKTYVKEVLEALEISEDMLPPIMKTGEALGELRLELCEKYGIDEGVRVFCGTFDHPGGAISMGVTEEGRMLLSCGTSWVSFIPIRNREIIMKNGFLCDPFLSDVGGPWGAMCSITAVGNTVNELVDKYISSETDKYAKFDEYAINSKNGNGGLVIDVNNINDEEILKYSKENIAYAIMEMPARLLKEKLSIFMESGVKFDVVYMAGGPTKSSVWTKITEEVTGLRVKVSNAEYSGAVGAAMIAQNKQF